MIGEAATGYPGYDSIITNDKATIGQILTANGYATSWFGKNHNTPAFVTSQAGPFDQWPSGMGFEYFYGFNSGETNQWQPELYRNHTRVYPYLDNPGYNLITDMADDAIDHIERLNALAPNKPFFLYYAPGATHAPHHPTPEWIEKFKGKFGMGWNALRDQIFANQKRLGVNPGERTADALARRPAEAVGRAHRRREEALRAADGGLRRLPRLHRPRGRPGDPVNPGHGQV